MDPRAPLQIGVATSAYQVEGAVDVGRVPSIWDTFTRRPGTIADGSTGEVACDHWNRMEEDVALMADLGVDVYRFSIAWPRACDDAGALSPSGLDGYDRLLDLLLAHGIEPLATLYHWDLPQPWQDRGGWPHRDVAGRFADYAELVGDRFGDRIRRWTTLNEPWCSAWLGHLAGVHAPGDRDDSLAIAAAHHLLLGHGLAVQALRAATHGDVEVGIVLNLSPVRPASDREPDVEAARRVDGTQNRWFLDPVLRGTYPDDVADPDVLARPHGRAGRRPSSFGEWPRPDHPLVRDGDLEVIGAPLDLLGVNYYFPQTVAAGDQGERPAGPGLAGVVAADPPGERTAMGWPVDPDGLVEVLTRLADEYDAPPLWVTENGAAYDDRPAPDGTVDDPDRIAFLDAHLDAVERARGAGVDVRGYLAWTLLDNFEWAYGYAQRFGIVRVDAPDLRRVPKASYWWLQERLAGR